MILSPAYRSIKSELKDFYVQPDAGSEITPYLDPHYKDKKRLHQKVVSLPKTKQNLEKWFQKRNIPIRFIYGNVNSLSPLSEKGVITFFYQPMLKSEPPTSWMIVHNLAHALFDLVEKDVSVLNNPKSMTREESTVQYQKMLKNINQMNLAYKPRQDQQLAPTTRSYKNQVIPNRIEAFHEIFTQWVVTGKIIFEPNTPESQKKAKSLEKFFRKEIDTFAKEGRVVYNIT